MVLPGRRHYDAAYVNTIAEKWRKNERGRHEGEYPAQTRVRDPLTSFLVGEAEGGNR